jgi:RNA polymerase sigma-70 factor (ECF subfamily)
MNDNDEMIFARAQQGDHSAFGLLVQRYQDRVYSIALKILRHQHDAEDATQQAFLHAWQKRQAYNPKRRFCTWLYRIVTNVCIDEYRRQQRRQSPPADVLLSALQAPNTPAREYEHRERCRTLATALQHVPVEARMVLVLCYMEGLSYAEVARIRGISLQTVKSQLRRAKALLRQRLKPHDEEIV